MNQARTSTTAVPNPGSDEAIMMGCTCAVIDNAHGIGYHGIPGQWIYTEGCPLHWPHSEPHREHKP